MKKSMLRAAGIVASALLLSALAACNGTAPTLTYQQQVAIACGAANGEIAILKADGVFTGGAADTLTGNPVLPGFAVPVADLFKLPAGA